MCGVRFAVCSVRRAYCVLCAVCGVVRRVVLKQVFLSFFLSFVLSFVLSFFLIGTLLAAHGCLPAGAHFVGHSFGSIVCAWVARFSPNLACRMTFLDPVCTLWVYLYFKHGEIKRNLSGYCTRTHYALHLSALPHVSGRLSPVITDPMSLPMSTPCHDVTTTLPWWYSHSSFLLPPLLFFLPPPSFLLCYSFFLSLPPPSSFFLPPPSFLLCYSFFLLPPSSFELHLSSYAR